MKAAITAGAFAVLLPLAFGHAAAQEDAGGNELARVYLDCQSGCDSEYIRTEITFVDYVRDRTTADVHVLITAQNTGAGGREFTLNFIGRNRFEGASDTLRYVSSGNATSDDIRRGLTRTIKVGLVRFAATTNAVERLDIRFAAPPESESSPRTSAARDPWNAWVFSVGTNGFMQGESSSDNLFLGLNVSASRTTDLWKLELGIEGNYNESNFQIDSVTTVKSLNRNYSTDISLVKSISPNVSVGMQAQLATTTFGNQKLVGRLAPAVEYNIFPYAQSTRRQFTFMYSVGANSYDYRELTIFNRTEETLGSHAVTASYSTRQPWGNTSITLNGSQFLHDRSKYRLSVSGNMNFRLFRGFTLNGGGSYSRIRDQIWLEAGDATAEEILLRQREIGTGYRYFFNFGIGYRFGSLFSPVVNPRMRAEHGGMEFCC